MCSWRSILGLALLASLLPGPASAANPPRVPVIFDTDIGDDIDDTWALALLLRCPELDVKLALGDYGRPRERAALMAKFLETVGRSDIPVGLGIEYPCAAQFRQARWIEGYRLERYPGKVHADGVQAMIDLILASPVPVTIIAVGPVPNLAEALRREPRIARNARVVGMHGSVRVGYGGKATPDAEWNVKAAPAALRAVLAGDWPVLLTPLDTCGRIQLRDARYAAVRDAKLPKSRAVMENYRLWTAFNAAEGKPHGQPERASTTLYDCVAVYLAISQDLCQVEELPIVVDDKGFTREDPAGRRVRLALAWKDQPAFEDWLTQRLRDPK